MKFLYAFLAVVGLTVMSCGDYQPTAPVSGGELGLAGGGFDQYGYNDTARIFNGPADGVDRVLDGMVWGDPAYANDKLEMKWNAEWDRGNDENWLYGPYDAWTDNQWNGQVPDGSGEMWHYRIKWIGSCGAYGTPTPNGGYCIWGQFEVTMSHGTFANQHFWDAHAVPSGYGN